MPPRLCFLFASLILSAGVATGSPPRPNIVYIISDDQTFTDFGFMGHPHVETPHLDTLAARSAFFPEGYVPSSVCRPSLVTLLTGLYPHQNGVWFNHPPPGFAALTKSPDMTKTRYNALREAAAGQIRDLPTLPRLLAAQGYRCFQTGKYWEGHWRNAGFTEGMTLSEPTGTGLGEKQLPNGEFVAHGNGDAGLVIGRETMQPIDDFLASCAPEEPVFLWYAPFLPHTPHDSPEPFRQIYESNPDIEPWQIPYYSAISQFDASVGTLLEILSTHDRAANTLIVFVIDNGWQPTPKRLSNSSTDHEHTRESKRAPFEPGLRTPILLCWDGHLPPSRHEGLVSSVDLLPTVLSALQLPADSIRLPGIDLLPAARGETPIDPGRAVFGEIYPGDASVLGNPAADLAYRWVRQGRHKLIIPSSASPWEKFVTRPALFDLAADPGETRPVDDPAIEARLRALLDAWWDGG